MKKPKIKIFEGRLQIALAECLDQGYRPASTWEIVDLINRRIIKRRWYTSGILYYLKTGRIKDGTFSDFKDVLSLNNPVSHVLFVYEYPYGLIGSGSLNSNGRFVGVQRANKKKKR